MPPLQSDRAPRACDICRKLKTRCYPSKREGDGCLRCETQGRDCSLTTKATTRLRRQHNPSAEPESISSVSDPSLNGINGRLARLENLVHTLVERTDLISQRPLAANDSDGTSPARTRSPSPTAQRDAPMFLIKGIADGVSATQPQGLDASEENFDPITDGMIGLEDAYELLSLFRHHYGRWVNFDDGMSLEQLMVRVRASSLLFCSICVVAARHAPRPSTNNLAPSFFREAKKLLETSLLKTPQLIEFFQATLLLSLWSTTVSQSPLSIDGWLLTGYVIQQGLASPISTNMKALPLEDHRIRACCTWNHICLAHLQYCVGTGRRSLLHETQIDRCAEVLEFEISQFEVRMVAELRLYWIIVNQCCVSPVNLSAIRAMLNAWKEEWSILFDQPRSQFLEMGYNFALLLAHCRSLHSQPSKLNRSKLSEMVKRARNIIDLAMTYADERTPHLTDHIWHIITFSAITLCQLTSKYHDILGGRATVAPLQETILSLVDWLRSVGLASHISRVLAKAIAAYQMKCFNPNGSENSPPTNTQSGRRVAGHRAVANDLAVQATSQLQHMNESVEYPLQDLAWTTFFDFNADTMTWPYSSDLANSNCTPSSNGSWAAFAYEAST